MLPYREIIRSKKRAGFAFPLFSILSRHSYECGDIYSLRILKDWAEKCGFSIIQILPLNDMGFGRSPYSSVSAFAIDPLFISLYMLGRGEKSRSSTVKSIHINHERIRMLKLVYLRQEFKKRSSEELFKVLDEFASVNDWIYDYSAFKILYEKNQGKHWKNWEYGSKYSKEIQKEIIQNNKDEFYFKVWLQYVAYQQLKEIAKELEEKGIYLLGDMPILTSENSADIWSKTYLFNLELKAGAPPDYFSKDGQNWGFPIINWDAMKTENYKWWRDRLKYLENFYHLYRIDHVLGMYRIWAVPSGMETARYGFYSPQIGTIGEEFTYKETKEDQIQTEKPKLDLKKYVDDKIIYEFQKDHYVFHWDFYLSQAFQKLSEDEKKRLVELSQKHLSEDEAIWKKMGEEILDLFMESSSMLPCAEDLGAVPQFVRESIHKKQIIGLDVVRWTRNFDSGDFFPYDNYRTNAVSTLSVHDTSISLAWWDEISPSEKIEFLKTIMDKEAFSKYQIIEEETKQIDYEKVFKAMEEIDRVKLLEMMVKFSLKTNSIFSINLLHDYILSKDLSGSIEQGGDMILHPEEHRINVPGTPESKNWSYRYPFHAEQLVAQTNLNDKIRDMLREAERL
ncbi:MAG: 4-alpha-glucanotransferase [Leptospiraceae bacterium]|nr:4-alpha-glucanotransferase [Leptospiraceae bacterium]